MRVFGTKIDIFYKIRFANAFNDIQYENFNYQRSSNFQRVGVNCMEPAVMLPICIRALFRTVVVLHPMLIPFAQSANLVTPVNLLRSVAVSANMTTQTGKRVLRSKMINWRYYCTPIPVDKFSVTIRRQLHPIS